MEKGFDKEYTVSSLASPEVPRKVNRRSKPLPEPIRSKSDLDVYRIRKSSGKYQSRTQETVPALDLATPHVPTPAWDVDVEAQQERLDKYRRLYRALLAAFPFSTNVCAVGATLMIKERVSVGAPAYSSTMVLLIGAIASTISGASIWEIRRRRRRQEAMVTGHEGYERVRWQLHSREQANTIKALQVEIDRHRKREIYREDEVRSIRNSSRGPSLAITNKRWTSTGMSGRGGTETDLSREGDTYVRPDVSHDKPRGRSSTRNTEHERSKTRSRNHQLLASTGNTLYEPAATNSPLEVSRSDIGHNPTKQGDLVTPPPVPLKDSVHIAREVSATSVQTKRNPIAFSPQAPRCSINTPTTPVIRGLTVNRGPRSQKAHLVNATSMQSHKPELSGISSQSEDESPNGGHLSPKIVSMCIESRTDLGNREEVSKSVFNRLTLQPDDILTIEALNKLIDEQIERLNTASSSAISQHTEPESTRSVDYTTPGKRTSSLRYSLHSSNLRGNYGGRDGDSIDQVIPASAALQHVQNLPKSPGLEFMGAWQGLVRLQSLTSGVTVGATSGEDTPSEPHSAPPKLHTELREQSHWSDDTRPNEEITETTLPMSHDSLQLEDFSLSVQRSYHHDPQEHSLGLSVSPGSNGRPESNMGDSTDGQATVVKPSSSTYSCTASQAGRQPSKRGSKYTRRDHDFPQRNSSLDPQYQPMSPYDGKHQTRTEITSRGRNGGVLSTIYSPNPTDLTTVTTLSRSNDTTSLASEEPFSFDASIEPTGGPYSAEILRSREDVQRRGNGRMGSLQSDDAHTEANIKASDKTSMDTENKELEYTQAVPRVNEWMEDMEQANNQRPEDRKSGHRQSQLQLQALPSVPKKETISPTKGRIWAFNKELLKKVGRKKSRRRLKLD